MENVITVKNMRESDAFTINTSVSGQELMKRAAQGVFDSAVWKGSIAIVCGSGNNGGDGYALAEILTDHGFSPVLLRLGDKLSEDGAFYYNNCVKKGVREALCDEYTDFGEYDIVVDCILGTGFSGTLREDMVSLIESINRSSAYVISVDINSGLSGRNGIASPIAVKSDLTVSVGYYKTGMFLNDAGRFIGSLVNVDIGIKLLKKQYYLISAEELSPFSGYSSVSLTADEFALRYALDEDEFRRNPLKVVSKESVDSKSVFIIDYDGSKLIVDQTYIYFQSDKVKSSEDIYKTF